MTTSPNYFLLRKNNSLQTIISSINPYVYASKDKDKTRQIKQRLELLYLREFPIHFHFDHIEENCDEEIILFDQHLLTNYGFSFLTENFDHRLKQLDGQILYMTKFPEHLTDDELLAIQMRMGRYHFKLSEQKPNNKSLIILNPWTIDNPLRDGEIFKLQDSFDSRNDAQTFIDRIIEGQFDIDGTMMTVGPIEPSELTEQTKEILKAQLSFEYIAGIKDEGKKIISSSRLADIEKGMSTLLELYNALGKTPYMIIDLV